MPSLRSIVVMRYNVANRTHSRHGSARNMDDVIEAQLNTITDTIVNTVPVNQIYLFGSYAYGTPKDDSDLDLYVIVPDNTGREIDIAIDIKKAIRKRELMPVDLLVSTISRFNDRITAPTLERRVHEQGRLVYG